MVIRMHRALYRTYRPSTFKEVVGQEHITDVLRYEVKEGRISHAYLFCGSRGTGKTSCAKILAKAVNCLDLKDGDPCGVCENCRAIDEGTTSDFLEMDAASNTGVDYIRDIRDDVMYAPATLKNRVYIIDEVHMLSPGASNALLKTLEEPPSNVIFILATTEMQKILPTVLSRCQRFEFRRIAAHVIAGRLAHIAEREGIELEEDASYMIARAARGGMRDAISLLETCSAAGGKVDMACVEEHVGGAGRKTIEKTVQAIADRDGKAILELIAEHYESSSDLSVFWTELIEYYRDMTVLKAVAKIPKEELRKDVLDLTEGEYESLRQLSDRFRYETLLYHMSLLDAAMAQASGQTGVSGRITAEMTLLRMTLERLDTSVEALAARIAKLEEALLYGVLPADSAPTAPLKRSSGIEEQQMSEELPVPKDDNGEYKVIEDFVELLHAFYRTQPSSAAFLTGAQAYISPSGDVRVEVSTLFALQKLQADNAAQILGKIISSEKGITARVNFVCNGGGNKPVDTMDELN